MDGKINIRSPLLCVGLTTRHENHWENVNVWTPDVVCPTRLGVQCRQFDPVSGPFSMNNERKDNGSVYSVGSQNHLVPIRSRKACFKRRTQLSNLLLIILFLLVASLFVTVVVLAVLYARSGMVRICDSEDCVRVAASLKESMNTSVDPCDDFYQYACGRWSREHPIPNSKLMNNWFSELNTHIIREVRDLLKVNMSASEAPWPVMQAKTLFASCMDVHAMDELGLVPLFDLLESLNLPMVPAILTNKTTNYIKQIASVKRNIGRDIFFGMDIMQDPRNNSRYVIVLDVPTHSNPFLSNKDLKKRMQTVRSRLRKLEDLDEEDIDEEDTLDEDENAELTYMTDVIKHVVSNGTIDACTSEDEYIISEKQLKECIQTLYKISSIFYYTAHTNQNQSVIEEDLSDDNYMYVDELQKLTDEYVIDFNSSLTPKLIWRPFIESLFESFVTLDLDNKDKILVLNLDYLKDAALILACYEEEDLESYIWWVVVDMVVPLSSKKLRQIWDTYVNEVLQVEIREPRSLECASDINEIMGMAVSWLFVDRKFHNNEAYKVEEMLGDIKEAFASLVLKTDWMDQSTKTATLQKSRKMGSEIGFPKWLFNEDKLEEYYKNIKIDLSETKYLENMMQILRLVLNTTWSNLHDDNLNNRSHWPTHPTDVNAFHSFHANYITIPAGILKFPFYELGLEALNYGAIGSVIGHELTHGFDNSGRHYDSEGNLRQWWTNETISEYNEKTKCFIKHYSAYYESEIDGYIDGELTLDENIADNGGLSEAFVAYKRWKTRHGQEPLLPGFTEFTHEQLLFLSYAHTWCESYTSTALQWMLEDSHSPNHIRVQGVLKNSKEFSTTWNCPVGSNMNPAKKCCLW